MQNSTSYEYLEFPHASHRFVGIHYQTLKMNFLVAIILYVQTSD